MTLIQSLTCHVDNSVINKLSESVQKWSNIDSDIDELMKNALSFTYTVILDLLSLIYIEIYRSKEIVYKALL